MPDTESVILHRVTSDGETFHGDPIDEADTDVTIEGARVAPNRGPGGEQVVDQTTSDDAMAVYLPPGAPVPLPTDEMTVRDLRWQVKGRPGVWPDGIEVFLRRSL